MKHSQFSQDPDMVLDHVAVAVSDLDQAQKTYEVLGLTFLPEKEKVEEQSVTTAFAPIDGNSSLELLEPINNQGPIAKFIEKNGPGIHHLCFKVKDVKAKCEELVDQGFKLIYQEPKVGAHNCLVNFIHPKSTGGVLIEISQPKPEGV